MKRFHWLFGIALLVQTGCPADVIVDAKTYDLQLPSEPDRFVLTMPLEHESARRGWAYLVRYGQYDVENGKSFTLTVVQDRQTRQPLALLHRINAELSVEAFDAMTDEEKIASATARADLSWKTAQSLYRAWVSTLLGVRWGDTGFTSTGPGEFYYIAAFTVETQYMAAMARANESNPITRGVVEIGGQLRELLLEQSPTRRSKMEQEIQDGCDALLRLLETTRP